MSDRTVAIVGRPNVGKSALFNRLAGRTISIVHNQPGVTRDRISAPCKRGELPFDIIDTGGIGSEPDLDFSKRVRLEAEIALEAASVIVLVVDAFDGLTPVDEELARFLRRAKKPLLLVVNKIDTESHDNLESDFAGLGFPAPIAVSAAHGRGIGELVSRIEALLPTTDPDAPVAESLPPLKLAVVGRPNVGKSSLINSILSDERTIVSALAGTTRDAVDIPYSRGEDRYMLIDTAGIRHRSKHDSSVEVFSVMRAERSIRRADLCALVLDAQEGVTAQDKKIAGLIQEASKPCLLLMNKWDLLKPRDGVREARDENLEEIRSRLFFLDYAPLLAVSAKTGESVGRVFRAIEEIRRGARTRIGTGVLNRFLHTCLTENPPPMRNNRRLKIYYATQAERAADHAAGATRFVLFVNDPTLLAPSYPKFLEGRLRRDLSPFPGIPVRFELRGKEESTPARQVKTPPTPLR